MKNLRLYEEAFIVIDMVNGFVTEGVLHDKRIKKIVPRQLELLKEAQDKNYLIMFVNDSHPQNAVEFKRFQNTQHCLKGTKETELIEELKPLENHPNSITLYKTSTSFMETPKIRDTIDNCDNLKKVNIIGCCTDICIANGAIALSNHYDAQNKDIEICVHEDAIATYNEKERQEYVTAAKLLMIQQGIQLVKKK